MPGSNRPVAGAGLPGCRFLAGFVCLLLLTGCTPKRVVRPPEPRPESSQPPRTRPAPPVQQTGLAAAALARQQIGKLFRYGSEGPDEFDCSGLVMFVFEKQGIDLPRVAREQAAAGRRIDLDQLIPGDLLFFGERGRTISHVGIYVGDGDFVHAPSSGKVVRQDAVNSPWWRTRLRVIRRVF